MILAKASLIILLLLSYHRILSLEQTDGKKTYNPDKYPAVHEYSENSKNNCRFARRFGAVSNTLQFLFTDSNTKICNDVFKRYEESYSCCSKTDFILMKDYWEKKGPKNSSRLKTGTEEINKILSKIYLVMSNYHKIEYRKKMQKETFKTECFSEIEAYDNFFAFRTKSNIFQNLNINKLKHLYKRFKKSKDICYNYTTKIWADWACH